MKRLILVIGCFLFLCTFAYARGKNLYQLVETGTLKVYLADFQSDIEKISPETFKKILGETLSARKKENFKIVENKGSADIIINSKILAFKYLEKDPIDNVIGGTSALIVDAMVSQNYAQVQIEFTINKAGDGRKLWYDKVISSVTQTNMPETDSIPKVLKECSKRFIFLCFGKSKW